MSDRWSSDVGVINTLRGLKFPLAGGEEAMIHEIARAMDSDQYFLLIKMPSNIYLRLDYERSELSGATEGLYDMLHDAILKTTGHTREFLDSKVHKALYSDDSEE